jgi:hypothetical protein
MLDEMLRPLLPDQQLPIVWIHVAFAAALSVDVCIVFAEKRDSNGAHMIVGVTIW